MTIEWDGENSDYLLLQQRPASYVGHIMLLDVIRFILQATSIILSLHSRNLGLIVLL
jgi:hypothetical protein